LFCDCNSNRMRFAIKFDPQHFWQHVACHPSSARF
jgi:hypothetical protein